MNAKLSYTAALMAAFLCAPAHAQTYYDTGGTHIEAVMPRPFDFTPLPPGQHNVAITSATPLMVPTGARYATICAKGSALEYTTDGTTPTASLGMALAAGACVALSGPAVLANFRAISATGTLDAEFFQ
ncbi:MAG: hypothetical protein JOY66_11730 [Acetobacteraceae bacterium]|nr:hypothetical protein [Acetobacteraceae bacterium]